LSPHPEVELGVGDAGVTLGAPPPVARFPGDPSVRTYPQPPRAPEDPNKVAKSIRDPAQLVIDTALKTGEIKASTAGNIYFEYSQNLKKIKTLTLILHTPGGNLDLTIR
jgi:hypothetical protein